MGNVVKGADGVYRDQDVVYCLPDAALLPFAEGGITVDGMTLYPIVKAYKVPKDVLMSARQRIVFA